MEIDRITALRIGVKDARDSGYVAIKVADLRWLLEQVENSNSDTEISSNELETNDEPEHQ